MTSIKDLFLQERSHLIISKLKNTCFWIITNNFIKKALFLIKN